MLPTRRSAEAGYLAPRLNAGAYAGVLGAAIGDSGPGFPQAEHWLRA